MLRICSLLLNTAQFKLACGEPTIKSTGYSAIFYRQTSSMLIPEGSTRTHKTSKETAESAKKREEEKRKKEELDRFMNDLVFSGYDPILQVDTVKKTFSTSSEERFNECEFDGCHD